MITSLSVLLSTSYNIRYPIQSYSILSYNFHPMIRPPSWHTHHVPCLGCEGVWWGVGLEEMKSKSKQVSTAAMYDMICSIISSSPSPSLPEFWPPLGILYVLVEACWFMHNWFSLQNHGKDVRTYGLCSWTCFGLQHGKFNVICLIFPSFGHPSLSIFSKHAEKRPCLMCAVTAVTLLSSTCDDGFFHHVTKYRVMIHRITMMRFLVSTSSLA